MTTTTTTMMMARVVLRLLLPTLLPSYLRSARVRPFFLACPARLVGRSLVGWSIKRLAYFSIFHAAAESVASILICATEFRNHCTILVQESWHFNGDHALCQCAHAPAETFSASLTVRHRGPLNTHLRRHDFERGDCLSLFLHAG